MRAPRPLRPRRVLVRVHRWLSLVLGAWICLMAATGLVLVFRADLERWARPELYRRSGPSDVGPTAAVDAVARAYPDRRTDGVALPAQAAGVYKVSSHERRDADHFFASYVDPGTGRVNGSTDANGGVLGVISRLHENLMQDTVLGVDGDDVVAGLGGAWAVVFLSGVYVWYGPRIRRRRRERLRLGVRRGRGRFTFTFDLHRAVGVVAVVPLLLVVLTGVNFAFRDKLSGVWERLTPAGADHVDRPAEPVASTDPGATGLTEDQVVAAVAARFPHGQVTAVSVPREVAAGADRRATAAASVTSGYDPGRGPIGYAGNVTLILDRVSGRVLHDGDPARFPVATQLFDTWAFPIHTGSFGATPTRIVWLAVAASPLVLSATGLSMWLVRRRKRRARGRVGPSPTETEAAALAVRSLSDALVDSRS